MKKNELPIIMSRIEAAESWRKSCYEDDWRNYINLFRSKLPKKRAGSNLFVPYIYMTCEVIRARVAESLFASRPYVTCLPRSLGDSEKAESTQTLLDWQFSDRMNIEHIFRKDLLENLIVLGTCITYTGWKKQLRKVKYQETQPMPLLQEGSPVLDPATGEELIIPTKVIVEGERVIYDDPVCINIDLFDFFCDPNATSIDDARYCGHREYRTKEELEGLKEYKIKWKDLKPINSIEGGRQIRMSDDDKNLPSDDFAQKDKKGLYEVLHYWEDERHVVIINRSQIALDEGNPFWHGMKPYDKTVYSPLSNSFYGVGVPQMLSSLQNELNTVRNQRIDYNSMALRRMWKMRRGCGLTADDLIWRQNGILQVENMDDLQEISVDKLPASAFSNEAMIKQDMRDVTGCHDIIMGLSGNDETATTTMTKDNNASLRFKDVVNNLADEVLVSIARKCVSLDQQFMSKDRAVRIMEDNAETIMVSPDDISGEFDIIYVGSSVDPMANKEMQKQRMVNLFNMLAANPLYQNDPEATINLMRELLKSYDIADIENMLPKNPQNQGGLNGQQTIAPAGSGEQPLL